MLQKKSSQTYVLQEIWVKESLGHYHCGFFSFSFFLFRPVYINRLSIASTVCYYCKPNENITDRLVLFKKNLSWCVRNRIVIANFFYNWNFKFAERFTFSLSRFPCSAMWIYFLTIRGFRLIYEKRREKKFKNNISQSICS